MIEELREVIPFKGGLPEAPLVVGLLGIVPNSINNLISKFVGYQSKVARDLKETIESIKQKEFNKCDEYDDINARCLQLHVFRYGYRINLPCNHGHMENCFYNEFRDEFWAKNCSTEKIEILKIRFARMNERCQRSVLEKCIQKQREMLLSR